MIQNIKEMTWQSLFYTRKDLWEVIQIQEQTEKVAPGSCKKLGEYWDDLHAVLDEIRRRKTY